MSAPRVIAVGGPPTFRAQVARALDGQPEAVEWMPSVTAAESGLTESSEPFDLLVLSPVVTEGDALGLAQFVSTAAPTTAVVVVRDQPHDGSLPRLIRAGVRDVVDLSQGGEDLRDALRRALAWSASLRSSQANGGNGKVRRGGQVISVFSSKGGAGKTFLACNLAAAIATMSERQTALLDLNLDLGDVFPYFGRDPAQSLQDLMALDERADRVAVMAAGVPLHHGLWGYGSPPNPGGSTLVGEAMGKVLRTLRSTFAYTIVDASSEYSDHVLASFDFSDWLCLITGLDVIGVRHLSLALQTLLSLGLPRERFRIVLNRANSKVGLSPRDIERIAGIRVNAMIPSSSLVPESLNKGRMVFLDEPRSPVAKSIGAFAEELLSAAQVATDAFAAGPNGGRR